MSHKFCAFAAVLFTLAGMACGDSASQLPQTDAAVSPDSAVPDAMVIPDAGVLPDAAPPRTSLHLEQVWYLTAGVASDLLIDFRTDPPSVTCGAGVGSSDGFEGTAVFTEPYSGDLLFYTDGRTVFRGGSNQMLANGSGLNGDPSSTEAALISPKYNTASQVFYVFTNTTNVTSPGTIAYSQIDLSLGADGTVTEKNVTLLTGNVGEGLDLLPHPNGQDFWVISYDGAENIAAFLVNESGVSTTPIHSSTGLTGVVMRASINHTLDYDSIVMSQNYGGTNGVIAVASFDRSTGAVSPAVVIATGDLGYHATFSGDGSKVYYVRGTEGWSGVAYQYDLLTDTETLLGGSSLGAAKLAPNGKLYWAGHGRDNLGVVNDPDGAGTACDFVPDSFYLEGCMSGYGVPNQTASYIEYVVN